MAGAGREGKDFEIMKVAQRLPKILDQRFCLSLTHKAVLRFAITMLIPKTIVIFVSAAQTGILAA